MLQLEEWRGKRWGGREGCSPHHMGQPSMQGQPGERKQKAIEIREFSSQLQELSHLLHLIRWKPCKFILAQM